MKKAVQATVVLVSVVLSARAAEPFFSLTLNDEDSVLNTGGQIVGVPDFSLSGKFDTGMTSTARDQDYAHWDPDRVRSIFCTYDNDAGLTVDFFLTGVEEGFSGDSGLFAVVRRGGGGDFFYIVQLRGGQIRLVVQQGGNTPDQKKEVLASVDWDPDTVYQITTSVGATEGMRIFVDGELVASDDTPSGWSTFAFPDGAVLEVGNRGPFGVGIAPGQVIDNLRLYNAELDPPTPEAAEDKPVVGDVPPPAPIVVSPAEDETVFWGGAVVVRWKACDVFNSYEVRITRSEDPENLEGGYGRGVVEETADAAYVAEELPCSEEPYFAFVRVGNEFGMGEWSPPRRFYIPNRPVRDLLTESFEDDEPGTEVPSGWEKREGVESEETYISDMTEEPIDAADGEQAFRILYPGVTDQAILTRTFEPESNFVVLEFSLAVDPENLTPTSEDQRSFRIGLGSSSVDPGDDFRQLALWIQPRSGVQFYVNGWITFMPPEILNLNAGEWIRFRIHADRPAGRFTVFYDVGDGFRIGGSAPLYAVGEEIDTLYIAGHENVTVPAYLDAVRVRGVAEETVPCEPPAPKFRRGDSNADGERNIADAITTLSYLFSAGTVPCLDACDTNDDGKVDIADAIYLLGYLFAAGPAPLEPNEECGPDPTAEDPDLGCEEFPPCSG